MLTIALSAEFGISAVVFGVVALSTFILIVAIYFNYLVRCNNLVNEAFSGIDVQLKRPLAHRVQLQLTWQDSMPKKTN